MNTDVAEINTTSDVIDDDKPVDPSDIISEVSFKGEYNYNDIKDAISKQASDYMNLDDDTDYTIIFFDQYHKSMEYANNDEDTGYREDVLRYLDDLRDNFFTFMDDLFELRLNLSIDEDMVSGGNYDHEWVIELLYRFFILDARSNFKTCISFDVVNRMPNKDELDDDEYFSQVQSLMELYTPIITVITPEEFLKYRGDEEVISLFENGVVSGNFLRKYTPKLYANEEFQIELINHITMMNTMEENNNE